MVDGLLLCATLTGHRGSHTPFVKQERKCPTLVQRYLSQTRSVAPGGGGAGVGDENAECLVGLSVHSAFHW